MSETDSILGLVQDRLALRMLVLLVVLGARGLVAERLAGRLLAWERVSGTYSRMDETGWNELSGTASRPTLSALPVMVSPALSRVDLLESGVTLSAISEEGKSAKCFDLNCSQGTYCRKGPCVRGQTC